MTAMILRRTALEGIPATRRNQQFASAIGLRHSLASVDYAEFLAMEGPTSNLDPCGNSPLDFLRLLHSEYYSKRSQRFS